MAVLLMAGIGGYAQSLPANTCGVVYTHDAAGNRTQRIYVCNNTARAGTVTNSDKEDNNTVVAQVTALYPNPTTGAFRITFTRPLDHARVTFMDMNGSIMQQRTVSGGQIEFDVSSFPAGMYWIKINDQGKLLSYKVVKQ